MATSLIVVEYTVGNKVCRKVMPTKKGALEWARERVQDADTPSATVLKYEIASVAEALAATIEGRAWFDAKAPIAVVVARSARVTR